MALSVPLGAVLVSIVIHSLWGGNPVAVKFSLLAFPPLTTAFLRFSVGIACIALWAHWRGIRLLPEKGEWRSLWVAAGLFSVQIALMNVGFHHTSGAMGSVLIATNPLFAVMFAHFLISGDRMTPAKALGLAVAMAGTSVALFADVDLAVLDFGAIGNWIVLSSALLLGFRLTLSARFVRRIEPTKVAMWQMALSLPLFGAGALMLEEIAWDRVDAAPIAGLLYQGVVIAGVGFTVSYHLMKHYTPSVMMSFNFVSPVAGVLFSAWLLGDRVGTPLLAGMGLVAVGLYLVARRSPGRAMRDGPSGCRSVIPAPAAIRRPVARRASPRGS